MNSHPGAPLWHVPGRESALQKANTGSLRRRGTPSRFCRQVAWICCLGCAGLGFAGLVGAYIETLGFLATIYPTEHDKGMVPTSAICLMALALALSVLVFQPISSPWRPLVWVISLLVPLTALAAVSISLDWDTTSTLLLGNLVKPVSPATAGSFAVTALGVAAISIRPSRLCARLATACAALLIAMNVMFLLGYLYNQQAFKNILHVVVAFPTALAFVALGFGMLAATGPRNPLLRNLLARNATGLLLRVFLPTTLGLIVAGDLARDFVRNFIRRHVFDMPPAELDPYHDERTDLMLVYRGLWLYFTGVAVTVVVHKVAGIVGRWLERARADLHKAKTDRDIFLAQVNHDLRHPLNHILGYCQLLEETPLDASQQSYLVNIRNGGKHLQALIEDILEYQKIIMGQIPIHWEEFEAAPAIREIASGMEAKLQAKENRLEVHCDPDLGSVRSDQVRLRQVLTNLLGNAAKFTKQGVVSVTARRERSDGTDWMVVRVADTGRGINPEVQRRLFTPFGLDRRDNPYGTGLGLAICKTLCEKMGGDIALVHSELGKGTTLAFRLPALPRAAGRLPAAAPVPEPALERPALPERPCTVLVIDDDPQVADLMKRFLEKEGFVIVVAGTGAQGLDMVKSVQPDVVTLDIFMPGIDGWGVLAALKNDAETAEIPVVIVSILDDRKRGFLLGANDYVAKPVNWERLVAVLRKFQKADGHAVLLVGHDADWRASCRLALADKGWDICEADDGPSALRHLSQHRTGLILLDLVPPVMDVLEFLEQVRQNPEGKNISIVALTATELTQEDRQHLNGAVQCILDKGRLNLDDLLRDVVCTVKKSNLQRPRPDAKKELLHAQDLAGRR